MTRLMIAGTLIIAGTLGLFSTAQPALAQSEEVLLAAVGDIACDPDATVTTGTCLHAATAALIAARNPSAVLALGDIQYNNGSLDKYMRAYDASWGQFKSITYPAVGNHEYLTAGAEGYHTYFGARTGGPNGYYAFNLNGWRIYSLNTECGNVDCITERDWMRADVRANRLTTTCQLMFMHRARYSSGVHKSPYPKPFWAVGYNNKFELALAGHDHHYERLAPMNTLGSMDPNGIRSFVVGTGGKSLYNVSATPAVGSEFRYNQNYGVLFLKLTPSAYSWEFQAITGEIIDSGSGTCK